MSPRRWEDAAARVTPIDQDAEAAAAVLHARLTKPAGSLGLLEPLGVRLAGMAGECPPPVPSPATVAVFAGDHGVIAQGVTPWPQEVTAQMVANFASGGAAINVLARQAGASVTVVDVGVASDLSGLDGIVHANVRRSTRDLSVEPAMTREEVDAALDVGARIACQSADSGTAILVTGDMGIANTTSAAALIGWFTGRAAAEVTGRGTGIDDEALAHKIAVVDRAIARHAALEDATPIAALAGLGGLEIAALAGYIVGGASRRVPVLIDGVIANAAALVAEQLAPGTVAFCIAGHRSAEPGARVALHHLGLDPLLDLGLRLGEGTGACLALPLVEAAARVLREMATFDAAGVAEPPA